MPVSYPYARTADVIERLFATNHVGHFLLTNLMLLKLLVASSNASDVSSYINVLSDALVDPNSNDH